MILSIFSIPVISEYFPSLTDFFVIFFNKAFERMSLINVLFPEPDTPATQTKLFKGIFTSIFFKLFSVAPFISIKCLLVLRLLGIGISFFPDKYIPVSEFLFFITSEGEPWAITLPP